MKRESIEAMAKRVYPQSQSLQMKWMAAVKNLRESSKKGWTSDACVGRMDVGVGVTPSTTTKEPESK